MTSPRRRVAAPGTHFEVAGVHLQVVRDIQQALLVAGIGNARRLAANPARIAPSFSARLSSMSLVFHPTPVSHDPTLHTCALGRRLTR